MRFATYLKNLLKNCQRIRDKFFMYECEGLSQHEKYAQSIYLSKKYLEEQLSPYGLLGRESDIRYILSFKTIKKKTIKKLGKAALHKGKYLFLSNVVWLVCDCHRFGSKIDLRKIEFKEFDIEKYRLEKYNRPSGAIWLDYPF